MRPVLAGLVLALAACPKKPEPPPPPPPIEVVKPEAEKPPVAPEIAEMARNFERVQFEFDSTALVGGSIAALRANADIMQKFPRVRVEVQGHADERGTTEYNLALGERRAQAIVDQLAGMGVARDRLKIVTFGEEKPLQRGESESAWAMNRRAEFRITASEGAPVTGTTP